MFLWVMVLGRMQGVARKVVTSWDSGFGIYVVLSTFYLVDGSGIIVQSGVGQPHSLSGAVSWSCNARISLSYVA